MPPTMPAPPRPLPCTHTWQYLGVAQRWRCLLCGGWRGRNVAWLPVDDANALTGAPPA